MGFDLGNKESRSRLHKAFASSRARLDVFCQARAEFMRDLVGSWYSEDGAPNLTYVNKINQTVRIYSTYLAYNNPRIRVRSFNPEYWPFCQDYQTAINRVVAEIDLKTTLQAGLVDAMFMLGVFNVRMADAGFVEFDDNTYIDPGKAWVDRISPDNLVLDMSARDVRAVRFIGHDYRVAYDAVMERDDYDRKAKKAVTPTSKNRGRTAEIDPADDDEIEDMVWLRDAYLPGTRQLATFWPDDESVPPLKVVDRDDGHLGPYKTLGLGLVPDNVIPAAPIPNLKPLHDLSNTLFRLLAGEAQRAKTFIAYRPGQEDDAGRAKKARDGKYIMMRDPSGVVPITFPGPDGKVNAFFLGIQEIYNILAGNEQRLAGLGAQADTLGQEQMDASAAAGMIGPLKGAMADCVGEIGRAIGGLMFDDEFLKLDLWREAENTGRMVPAKWEPGKRKGLKSHYDFSVEANSLAYRPPEVQLSETIEYLQSLAPIFPLIQMGVVDLKELTRMAAEARNNPDLLKIVKGMDQMMMAQGGGDPHQATKPPMTSRETVRSNVSRGPQGQGMMAVLGQMMQSEGNGSNGVMIGGRR